MHFPEKTDKKTIGDIDFWVGGDADAKVISEVVDGDCYGLKSSPVQNPRVVVDVGAHVGGFALLARKTWPDARIICYEPSARNVRMLSRNAEGKDVRVVEAAVTGGESGSVRFVEPSAISQWLPDGSTADGVVVSDEVLDVFSPKVKDALCRVERTSVRAVSIKDVLSEMGSIDFLKLDCEGSEVAIMEALREELGRIGTVRGEYHGLGSLNRISRAAGETHDTYCLPLFRDLGYFSCEPRKEGD
jgi:FkbM family methyltransferase